MIGYSYRFTSPDMSAAHNCCRGLLSMNRVMTRFYNILKVVFWVFCYNEAKLLLLLRSKICNGRKEET